MRRRLWANYKRIKNKRIIPIKCCYIHGFLVVFFFLFLNLIIQRKPPRESLSLCLSENYVNLNKVLMTSCIKSCNNGSWKSWCSFRSFLFFLHLHSIALYLPIYYYYSPSLCLILSFHLLYSTHPSFPLLAAVGVSVNPARIVWL